MHTVKAQERLLKAAYKLFSRYGVNQIGIDRVLKESGCAKSSLYKYFKSKTDLVLAFLDMREEVWTHQWLEAEIYRRADAPEDRLLAIFDAYDDWFRDRAYEGCSFIRVLLETKPGSRVHNAAAKKLSNIRAIIERHAAAAGLEKVEEFANTWLILMHGSIVAAHYGNREAGCHAKCAARMILQGWLRQSWSMAANSTKQLP